MSSQNAAPTTQSLGREALVGQIAQAIVTALNLHHIDPKTLNEETSLRDGGLELDSVDMLELVVEIEQKFRLKVSDAETGKKYFRSIGTIADLVEINSAQN